MRPSLLALAALCVLVAISAAAAAGGPPPKAGFTAATRADSGETSKGQNEPQVTVDGTGTAFVTWQSGQNGSGTSKTKDGTHFTYLGYPDPATPNSGIGSGDIGDVTITSPPGGGAVYWGNLAQGGQTWAPTAVSAIQPGSAQALTSTCNTIPTGIAVDQNGAHKGRIYAAWETSDLHQNAVQGCDYTQAEAFDHIFLSYSDDGGATWTSRTVFNDQCAPNPPTPPVDVTECQDVSELFTAIAVDDAGNVDVAYVSRDVSQPKPEYDVYVATSTDGGNTFTSRKANTDTGTHYFPWIAAGGNGGVDVVYYDTPYVEGVGALNKPAAAPSTAQWTMQMSQSLDGGKTWTQSNVSGHAIYFGDICTTGIFCGLAPDAFDWGNDRILFDDFGVAVGPDGGARVAWTDAHDSWTGSCQPGGSVSCQTTHVDFACPKSGLGVGGQKITGCGQSKKP